MNMKYLALFFGACLGLVGCVVETGSGGNGGGGNGGDGGSGAEGGGGSGVGGNTTTSEGGGGNGGGPGCLSCAEYLDEDGELCEGSDAIYDALAVCTCGSDLMGMDAKCYEACGDNVCSGMAPSSACQGCVLDTNAGCGSEYQECANDAG